MKKILVISLIMFLSAISLFANEKVDETYSKLFEKEFKEAAAKEIFAKSFLKMVPENKILEILKIYSDTLGKFSSVDKSKTPFKLNFEKGFANSTIGFDKDGKINTLWFGAPELAKDSLDEVLQLFKDVKGKVSVCLLKNNTEPVIELNADEQLGVGSSFKLYVLKALKNQIKEGKRSWKDLVEISNSSRSFPSGILQDWPQGMSLTIESLAALMISLSDNTATDHLFNLVGREEMTKIFPTSFKPAFNTFEMFKLKIFFPEEGKKFVAAKKEVERIKILEGLAGFHAGDIASASVIMDWKEPKMIDELEWFISTRELCNIIFELKDLDLLTINPAYGLVDKKDWKRVCFKGGSEPGVLNFTWFLQPKEGEDFYTLSCTFNNPKSVEKPSDFEMAASRLIKLIAKQNSQVH